MTDSEFKNNSRQVILVDMDDTIENFLDVLLSSLNKEFGTYVTREDNKEWDMQKAFPALTTEQIFYPLRKKEFWMEVEPYYDAIYYLQKLISDGYDVYIVTASHYETMGIKAECVLKKYFPFIDYQHIIMASNKRMIIGDYLVDDNPDNLVGGRYYGILFDQPHNRSFVEYTHNIERVFCWKEVYEYITNQNKGEISK